MEKLTAQQAKMVIEYFSAQAAEDYPGHEDRTFDEMEKHLWMTRYQCSLAVERNIGEWWWEALVECQMDLQSFDRDPDAWLDGEGRDSNAESKGYWREHLKRQVSWSIDNAWNNSGA